MNSATPRMISNIGESFSDALITCSVTRNHVMVTQSSICSQEHKVRAST